MAYFYDLRVYFAAEYLHKWQQWTHYGLSFVSIESVLKNWVGIYVQSDLKGRGVGSFFFFLTKMVQTLFLKQTIYAVYCETETQKLFEQ